jgi:hypothetical protein
MGEHYYNVEGNTVNFVDTDGIDCLCTFPGNDTDINGEIVITKDRLLSLALLGCVVALLHNTGELENRGKDIYLPDDVTKYYRAIKNKIEELK